jgi:hypothetical protein
MSDDLDHQVKRALEALLIECYIKRGRAHASTASDALRQSWPEAFCAWIEDRTEANGNLEEDIRAELLMRGIEISLDDAGEAGAKMLAEIRGLEPDLDEMAEHPAMRQLMAKIDEKPN